MTDLAVIMSVYKNDKLEYVVQSVQSILNQTFTNFSYFIIFDGPVDSEIESYITSIKDSRLHIFRLPANGGLACALNHLLEIVMQSPHYKMIARMDADDIANPSRFEKQRNFLLNNQDISCIGSWFQEIDESGRHLSYRKLPTDHESLKKRYYTRTPFAHPTVMYRCFLIEKAGFYPTNTVLMEDNVLWGRALKAGMKFSNLPEYLLKFRIDNDFYRRRSGFIYGLNYIKTRFEIIRYLKLPGYSYILSFWIGVVKMLPSAVLQYFYIKN
jgi:glycosyltransferase involved in cell wall biosynthesis